MKTFAIFAALVCLSTPAAEARSMRTVLERKMSEAGCEGVIRAYASRNGLGLKSIGSTDYILLDSEGERVGNGYHSEGTCYIYMDNEM